MGGTAEAPVGGTGVGPPANGFGRSTPADVNPAHEDGMVGVEGVGAGDEPIPGGGPGGSAVGPAVAGSGGGGAAAVGGG